MKKNTAMSANEIPTNTPEAGRSPRFVKKAVPKIGKQHAKADLKRPLPASTEAAWLGYAIVIYIKMLWKVRKSPGK